ncbi:MAG: hypothetical protein R3300_13105 [Candidatus Promineifilaceae bacterium]|nr:hypothetical protein [Candidatus Promineifilaceae bacterium]
MKDQGVYDYRLVLGEGLEGKRKLPERERELQRTIAVKPTIAAQTVVKALEATPGAQQLVEKIPNLAKLTAYLPIATFSVCQKTGTATYLDIWDADHFDGFTDMQSNLSDCRVWFSAEGFAFWDSPQTKTGRINCYFRAPSDGSYVCNVQLQSYAGPAQVECLIDDFSYGPLPFNGSIDQPHPCNLSAGYHSFRIRQLSGSYFFHHLSVWRV